MRRCLWMWLYYMYAYRPLCLAFLYEKCGRWLDVWLWLLHILFVLLVSLFIYLIWKNKILNPRKKNSDRIIWNALLKVQGRFDSLRFLFIFKESVKWFQQSLSCWVTYTTHFHCVQSFPSMISLLVCLESFKVIINRWGDITLREITKEQRWVLDITWPLTGTASENSLFSYGKLSSSVTWVFSVLFWVTSVSCRACWEVPWEKSSQPKASVA